LDAKSIGLQGCPLRLGGVSPEVDEDFEAVGEISLIVDDGVGVPCCQEVLVTGETQLVEVVELTLAEQALLVDASDGLPQSLVDIWTHSPLQELVHGLLHLLGIP
jgi:hypothetical protein